MKPTEPQLHPGTGRLSFREPAVADAMTHAERTLFLAGTEVRSGRCRAHLGHVFDGRPTPTGNPFCIDSCALDLRLADASPPRR